MSSSTTVATTAADLTTRILNFVSTWTWRLGGFSFSMVLILGAALYAKQESLLYLPTVQGIPKHNRDNPRGYRSPSDRGLEHWFNIQIPTADGIHIHAWYIIHPKAIPAQQSPLPTVIFFHGNAGNIGLRLPNAWQMMQQLQCHVLLVEYRGYGDSSSELPPNEVGLQRDAQAVYEWISQQVHGDVGSGSSTTTTTATVKPSSDALQTRGVASFLDKTQLFVFGRSLGGAVAFSLAAQLETNSNNNNNNKPPLAGLIVENTFLSISAMVDKIFPFLTPIKPFVLRMDWNNEQRAAQLSRTPVLYLAGARDELVPHRHMQQLYQTSMAVAANPWAVLHVISNGTHNESWYQGGTEYWQAVKRFMQQAAVVRQQQQGATTMAAAGTTTSTTATAATIDMAGDSQAIPTMSSKLVDMAQQAFASSSSSTKNTESKKSS